MMAWLCAFLLHLTPLYAAPDARLADAAKRQDRKAVEALLRQGLDVNSPAPDGATALHWAAYYDDPALADLLITAHANANAANEFGVTPLVLASANGSLRLVDRLLKAGADPNAGPGETPLMIAARTGSLEVVKLLIASKADVNGKEPTRDQTVLMWAVSNRHPEIVRTLVSAGANVNARTKAPAKGRRPGGATITGSDRPNIAENGLTPLLFAARVGDIDSARILLDAGANVNDVTADGLSALVLATVRAQPHLAMMLLDRGADANADGAGYTALHWAAGSWESELTVRAITVEREGGEWYTVAGLREGRVDLVKALLAHGANANARLKNAPSRAGSSRNPTLPELTGATPLLLAAQAGEVDVMRVLLEHGADPALRTKANGTPLMGAAGLGRVPGEVVVKESATLAAAKLLVELGADVNAADEVGNTALHYAAYLRRDSIVQLLAEKGATLDVANKYRETPLWTAELVMQFCGGGTFQVLPSSTSAALRKLGAHDAAPPYARYRPTEWPDIPRERPQASPRPRPAGAEPQAPACGSITGPPGDR
jgi:ankyrin repeat protein